MENLLEKIFLCDRNLFYYLWSREQMAKIDDTLKLTQSKSDR